VYRSEMTILPCHIYARDSMKRSQPEVVFLFFGCHIIFFAGVLRRVLDFPPILGGMFHSPTLSSLFTRSFFEMFL